MHRTKFLIFLVLYIGTFCSVLNADVEEPDPEVLEREGKVFVEPTYVESSRTKNEYNLMSYRERRHKWGITGALAYSTYQPENYEPEFAHVPYKTVYGRPTIGIIEGVFTVKRNMPGFSAGMELGVGSFRNDNSDDNYVGSVLAFIEGRIGGVIYLDTMFSDDPLFVPYGGGGAYMMFYRENLEGNVSGGTTQAAAYVNGGIAMQLDWIDPKAARVGYEQSSLLRSYLYVEARKYWASVNKKDPDFSNSVSGAVGVRCEF